MSLRDEMRKMARNDKLREASEYGEFSRWWYFGEGTRNSSGRNSSGRNSSGRNSSGRNSSTFIVFMLNIVTSDEELELLWARWNIEREN